MFFFFNPVLKRFSTHSGYFVLQILSTVFEAVYIFVICLNSFPKGQILDFSKLKEFADDNFKFERNGRKFSKWIENTVEKGEIARYEQFLLFSQCFQKTCTADT